MAELFDLRGVKEVKRELAKLPPRMQKNIMRGAVTQVARGVRDDAKADVPVGSGNLKKNIIAKTRRGTKFVMRASVIVREEGKRGDPKNAFYWRFVEFGHFDRSGSVFIPGRHFITNAYEKARGQVDRFMARYVRLRIAKLTKR